jgi:hypothetical protein
MSRFTNPVPQFWLDNGTVAASGKMEFYENRDYSTLKTTFSDSGLNIQNTNPVNLDGQGRMPSCFGQGLYSVKLYAYDNAAPDKKGALQWTRDDVDLSGGGTAAFDDWSPVITYSIGTAAKDNGKYYILFGANTSKGERPSTTPTKWEELIFLTIHNPNKTYFLNDNVVVGGFIYRSLENNNTDTPPSAKWANLTFNNTVAGDLTVSGTVISNVLFTQSFSNFPEVKTAFRVTPLNSVTNVASIDPALTIGPLPLGWYDVEVYIQFTTTSSTANGMYAEIITSGNVAYGFSSCGIWDYVKSTSTQADSTTVFNSMSALVYPTSGTGRNALRFKGIINHSELGQGMAIKWGQGTLTPGAATRIESAFIKATRLKSL